MAFVVFPTLKKVHSNPNHMFNFGFNCLGDDPPFTFQWFPYPPKLPPIHRGCEVPQFWSDGPAMVGTYTPRACDWNQRRAVDLIILDCLNVAHEVAALTEREAGEQSFSGWVTLSALCHLKAHQ